MAVQTIKIPLPSYENLHTIAYSDAVKKCSSLQREEIENQFPAFKELKGIKNLLDSIQKITLMLTGGVFAVLGIAFISFRFYQFSPNRISDIYYGGMVLGGIASFSGFAVLSLKWLLEKRLRKAQAEFDHSIGIEIIKKWAIPKLKKSYYSFDVSSFAIHDPIRKEVIIVGEWKATHIAYDEHKEKVLKQWDIPLTWICARHSS